MESKTVVAILLVTLVGLAVSHIRVWEPTARSTLWRDPRWAEFSPPQEIEDDGVYCGRVMQLMPPVECGVCGDPWNLAVPRPHETGGRFANGVIVANYTQGQSVPFNWDLTIPHNGSVYVEICDEIPETDACFEKYPKLELTTEDGTFTNIPVGMTRFSQEGTMKLPFGVSARQCVIRTTYRGGFKGQCEDGTEEYGCGNQQHFRACSDVSIAL